MKLTHLTLAAALVLGSATVVAATPTSATAAAPAPAPCGPLGSSGFVATDVGVGLSAPVSVDVDATGRVFVGERGSGDVELFTPSGGGYTQAKLPGSYNVPFGVAVDDAAGTVWITNSGGNHLVRRVWDGTTYQQVTPSPAGIRVPGDVALDSTGTAYVASAIVSGGLGRQILKLSPTAPWTTSVVRDTTGDTWGVAVGPDDSVYNTEHPDKIVRSAYSGGTWTSTTIPSTGLSSPSGLAVDADGIVYVADTESDRIVAFTPSGASWTQAVLPITGLSGPTDVAAGPDGMIYVVDSGNNRVLKAVPAAVAAASDTASTTLGNAVTTTVRANDTVTGGTLADPTIAKNPKHGTATVNANGTITYTPDAGFSGTDTYSYAVRDGAGAVCATAKVTVTVAQGNECDPLGTSGGNTRLPIETGTDYPNYYDVDADGSIFVTDSENDEIVRLTPSASGYDRTVVATGVGNVTAIAIDDSDASGTLWVVRYPNEVLRLTPSGAGYTIADTYSGPLLVKIGGIDVAPDGDVFVSTQATTSSAGSVVRMAKASDYAPTLVATGFQFVHQVTVDDAGAVYLASYTRVVKFVDNGSGWTQTDAVTGLGSGQGVAVDSTGTIWVSTSEDPGVWSAAPAGSGYGTKQLHAPWGEEYATTLQLSEDDDLYVSSFDSLWSFGPTTLRTTDDTATVTAPRTVTTDVRANDGSNVRLDDPTVVSTPAHGTTTVNDDGTITYAPDAGFSGTDSYRYLVRDDARPARVCGIATVTITVAAATGCGPTPASAYVSRASVITTLQEPTGIVSDANNAIWSGDPSQGMVFIAWAPTYTPNGIDSTGGIDPQGIAMDAVGAVYYADEGEHEIVKLTRTGYTWARSVLATALQRPSGVAVDADGNVYFSENSSGHVHKLTPDGAGYTTSLVGAGLERPRGVAVDADGNVFVADWADEDKIVRFSPSGATYTKSVVALGLDNPYGVAVEADGTLIVGDSGNKRVLRLVPNGTGYDQETLTAWGGNTPTWVATMPSGDLLVTDKDAQHVVALRKRRIGATDDTATTTVQTAIDADVRANDAVVPAGTGLTSPTTTSTPTGGSVTVTPDGTIRYTPSAGFSGLDTVRYRVTDNAGPANVCAEATLRVTVQNAFTPGPGVTTPQNTPVTTPFAALASTTGKPLDPTAVTSVTAPGHGSIGVDPTTGAVTYTPEAGHIGGDSYVVQVCDTSVPVQCADVLVSVTVSAGPAPTQGPGITVTAPAKATMKLTGSGRAKPLTLSAQVTITGLAGRTAAGGPASGRAISGTATLYGPAEQASNPLCTPAEAVATVAFTPADGTNPLPPVQVTRPGHYTWVASTSGDGDRLAATTACGAPGSTTLVHRPALGRFRVQTGYSGVRADRSAAARRIRPVKVTVPAVGLRAEVRTVGMRKGSMRIPTDITRGGWLNGSAAPGESVGSTVIAGHVSDRADRPGAFGRLRNARPGQIVSVRTASGEIQRYRIRTITTQPRRRGLAGATVSTTGEHQLTLVTCTGRVTYRNGNFHYTKNLVVTATPVG